MIVEALLLPGDWEAGAGSPEGPEPLQPAWALQLALPRACWLEPEETGGPHLLHVQVPELGEKGSLGRMCWGFKS